MSQMSGIEQCESGREYKSLKRHFCHRFGQRLNFRAEFSGGISASIVSLPQSMAYGLIAFAPLGPDMAATGLLAGLYSAIFVGIISALFGSTQVMISGSRAATALVFSAMVGQLLRPDMLGQEVGSEVVLFYAFFAVFLAGLFQAGFGVSQLGSLVKYVPHPVIAGFLSSSALLIIIGQYWVLTGLSPAYTEKSVLTTLSELPYGQILLALLTAVTTLLAPRLIRSVPAPVVSLVLGTALFHGLMSIPGLELSLGATMSEIPMRFPSAELFTSSASILLSAQTVELLPFLITAALSIAAISSLDTLMSTTALDGIMLTRTRSSPELVAQGGGNMLSAIFFGLPGSGSMARTAPVVNAGAKTQIANLINIGVILFSTVFLAPVISKIPQAVLSGILLIIGIQLIDRWTLELFKEFYRKKGRLPSSMRSDLAIIVFVIATALYWNLMVAVGVGIALSAIIFIKSMSRTIVRRSYNGTKGHARRYSGDSVMRLLEDYSHRILVLELEGVIFFGSADFLELQVNQHIEEGVTHFVLDMKRITDIDSSGAVILQRIYQKLHKQGLFLLVSYIDKERRETDIAPRDNDRRVHPSVRRFWIKLKHLGVIDVMGEEIFWPDTDAALGACKCDLLEKEHPNASEQQALTKVMSTILVNLDMKDILRIRRMLQVVHFRAGDMIFKQGDVGDSVYLLSEGSADVGINIPGSERKKCIETLLPGALFGEMAVLDEKPRAANIISTGNTICYRLDKKDFHKLRDCDPHLAFKLMTNLCQVFASRLREANEIITELEI